MQTFDLNVLKFLLPNPKFYGWIIVSVCMVMAALSSPGQSFAISLYIEELIRTLGISRLQISSVYGSMTFAAALCLPWIGALADKMKGRKFLALALLGLIVAMGSLASATNVFMVAGAFFFLRLFGQGVIGLGTLTVIVLWFKRYRGRALAMSALGYSLGELVYPATILALTAWLGWRGSLYFFALLYLLVFLPVVWITIRERKPNEAVDGESSDAPGETGKQFEADFHLSSALRTPVFWLMLAAVAVLPMVVTALVFHQVALFEKIGWGLELVPLSFMCFALASVAAMYISGLVLENVPSRFGVTFGMFAATAATLIPLFFPTYLGSIVYGAVLGAASGILSSANSLIWPEYYGIRALGAIKGVVNMVRNGSTAIGPPLLALLMGDEHNVTLGLGVLCACCLGPAVLAIFLKPPNTSVGLS